MAGIGPVLATSLEISSSHSVCDEKSPEEGVIANCGSVMCVRHVSYIGRI